MRVITVETARETINQVGIYAFAAEMGISNSAAENVATYVGNPHVPGSCLVLLSDATIDGVQYGPGNRCQDCTA